NPGYGMNGSLCFTFHAGNRLGLAPDALHIISAKNQARMSLIGFSGSKVEAVIFNFVQRVFAILNELATQLGSRLKISGDVVFHHAYCESPFPVHGGLFAT